MLAPRLLPLIVILSVVSLFAQAQTDSRSNTMERTSQWVQQRVDSLPQTTKYQNQVNSYHDSVRHILQARRDSVISSRLIQSLDTLQTKARGLPQTTSLSLPGELPTLPSLPAAPSVPPLPSLDQLSTRLTDRLPAAPALERVRAVSGKVGKYTQAASTKVQQGAQLAQNAPASLEQYLAQQEALSPLAKQQSALEAWQANPMGEAGNQLSSVTTTQPEALAEQAKQRALQQAKQHFAQHTNALEDGQQQLSKLKQKYKSVQTEQDKFERATSLRGEPWTARLLLGSYFQFYREPHFQVDLSPFVGYRFNTRWSVGVGGSYRAAFRRLPGSAPVYQGRVFVEGEVYRGFAAHVAYERSSRSVPVVSLGERGTIVDQHLLAGIGKSYSITRNIRGTTLLLYRPGDIDQSLHLSRWNLRTGFSLENTNKTK